MSHRTVVYAFKRPDDVWCAELKNLDTDETVKIQHAATRDEAVRGLFEEEVVIEPVVASTPYVHETFPAYPYDSTYHKGMAIVFVGIISLAGLGIWGLYEVLKSLGIH